MDRLTERLSDGQYAMRCSTCELAKAEWCTAYSCRNRIKDRLTAYEDTGLTPEEISAMQAENATLKKALNLIQNDFGDYLGNNSVNYYIQKARETDN